MVVLLPDRCQYSTANVANGTYPRPKRVKAARAQPSGHRRKVGCAGAGTASRGIVLAARQATAEQHAVSSPRKNQPHRQLISAERTTGIRTAVTKIPGPTPA